MAWIYPFLLGMVYAFFFFVNGEAADLTNANIWMAVAYIVARK